MNNNERTDGNATARSPGKVDGARAPVVGKVYDLLLWFVPVAAKLRRDVKYTIGERVTEALLDAHGLLTNAAYGHQRKESLAGAARRVDRARVLLRLAHDLGVLDHRRYSFASERLVEIGRMIGGWRRSLSSPRIPRPADRDRAVTDA